MLFPSLGAEVNASPLWNLAQVKMEPQENEEANVHGHGVLGSDVFEEPMSGMSEAGMPQSPNGSESSYGSHSADSLMGSSPVFNQRCKKKMKKMWKGTFYLVFFFSPDGVQQTLERNWKSTVMIPTQGWPLCVRDLHKITMRGLMCSALQLPSFLASVRHSDSWDWRSPFRFDGGMACFGRLMRNVPVKGSCEEIFQVTEPLNSLV